MLLEDPDPELPAPKAIAAPPRTIAAVIAATPAPADAPPTTAAAADEVP